MKSGYDQFFKQVRKQASQSKTRTPNPKVHATSPDKRPGAPTARTRRRSHRTTSIPIGLVCVLLAGTSLSLWGFLNPRPIERLINSVQIHFLGQASAEEKTAQADGTAPAKSTAPSSEAKPDASAKNTGLTPEQVSIYSKLNERKKELDLREAELNKLEAELQQQKMLLDKRMQDLEQMRSEIASTLKDRVQADDKKVDKLVDFYSNMKPQQAAKIIESLDEDLAVETLSRMKKKNAAEIMNLLDPKKAESLSEKFAGYKR